MNTKVEKNKYGYYNLKTIPSKDELKEYYSKKYYQEENIYSKVYEPEEISYFNNKIEQKFNLFKENLYEDGKISLLDVGCGEGFTLNFFKKLGWELTGLDFAKYGLKNHNSDCLQNIIVGDIFDSINELINRKETYDVIWLDNVLEHVNDPYKLLSNCRKLSNKNTFLIIEVPNDFSALQLDLRDKNLLLEDNWVVIPDHISYFNKEGLINICRETNWNHFRTISDFPIDFNLYNLNSNYYLDKTKGKEAHQQRIYIENLLHQISIEKSNNFYQALADLGLGRQIIGVFN